LARFRFGRRGDTLLTALISRVERAVQTTPTSFSMTQ
jgi:hypothetical protein